MKRWIIGAALVFTSLGVAAQQDRRNATPEERAQKMTDRMAVELGLSEEQKKEIYVLQLDQAKQRQAEEEKMKAERDLRREKMKEQDSKIKEILTEEQKLKWQEIKQEHRDRRRPGGEVHHRESLDYRGRGGKGGK
jgi:Spy/CpxP family protein refolding chaperone